jgi:hypothetical protein
MIEKYSFGTIVIDGQTYRQDLKIFQGRIIHPWWRKKGHSVEQEDVRDILQAAPEILILGKGDPGMMKSTPDLRQALKKSGIELREEPTAKAIKDYNQLLEQGKEVAAGFHLTC